MKNLTSVSRYYITIKCRTNDKHAIHKENCPFITDDEKMICLGHFISSDDAKAEAHKHFDHSHCCRFCIPEDKEEFAETLFPSSDSTLIIPAENQLSNSPGGSLSYLMN